MNAFQKTIGAYALLAAGFFWGFGVSEYHWPPYNELSALNAENFRVLLTNEPVHHLVKIPPHFETEHPFFPLPKQQTLAVASMFDGQNAIRLFSSQGKLLKEWVFDPTIPFARMGIEPREVELHGFYLSPEGDAYANFEEYGFAKVNRCNEMEWVVPNTHHSVDATPRHTFWVPGRRELNDVKGLNTPVSDDLLLEIDAKGKILRKLSLLEIIFENDLQGIILATGKEAPENEGFDFLHMNDIEELRPEVAGAFPAFEAGDLLVSLRNVNLVMVLNPDSRKVKWYQTGPWLRQHDPDFEADGTISVFDNQMDFTGGSLYGGSRILKMNPQTRHTEVLYSDPGFYSEIRGKHSIQPDGTLLVTEAERGRVFLVNPKGKIIFEYANRYDNTRFYEITQAELLPEDYFTVKLACMEEVHG